MWGVKGVPLIFWEIPIYLRREQGTAAGDDALDLVAVGDAAVEVELTVEVELP